MLSRTQIIDSLVRIGKNVQLSKIPKGVIENAITQNPWFTPYFIQERLENIRLWLHEELLHNWLEPYTWPLSNTRKIGIIAAGNIPLVGIHDLIAVVLSGHSVWIKYSRRDQVLMEWFVSTWLQDLPALASRIHMLKQESTIDLLVASGSNNTARYLNTLYPNIEKIIRKNRYT